MDNQVEVNNELCDTIIIQIIPHAHFNGAEFRLPFAIQSFLCIHIQVCMYVCMYVCMPGFSIIQHRYALVCHIPPSPLYPISFYCFGHQPKQYSAQFKMDLFA